MYCDFSDKIFKFLNNWRQESLFLASIVILIILILFVNMYLIATLCYRSTILLLGDWKLTMATNILAINKDETYNHIHCLTLCYNIHTLQGAHGRHIGAHPLRTKRVTPAL